MYEKKNRKLGAKKKGRAQAPTPDENISKIVVNLTTLGQPSASVVDEIALPQSAESLVTRNIAVAVKPWKKGPEVVRSILVRGSPEPELSTHNVREPGQSRS